MLAGLLVVVLVEAAHQVLEDRSHRVVVQPGESDGAVGVQDSFGGEIDLGCEETVHDVAQDVGRGKPVYLVAELEFFYDVLDVGGEAVQVGVEVVPELGLGRPGCEVPEAERGGVEEGLSGGMFEDTGLVLDAGFVEPLLFVQDFLLVGFQHGVEAPEDGHGEDDVAVFAPDVDVAEVVVSDSPDEVGYLA